MACGLNVHRGRESKATSVAVAWSDGMAPPEGGPLSRPGRRPAERSEGSLDRVPEGVDKRTARQRRGGGVPTSRVRACVTGYL